VHEAGAGAGAVAWDANYWISIGEAKVGGRIRMRRRYDGLREVFIHAFVVWVGVLGDTEFLYLSERVSCCGVLVPDSIAVRV
jgi:hypothetical protein